MDYRAAWLATLGTLACACHAPPLMLSDDGPDALDASAEAAAGDAGLDAPPDAARDASPGEPVDERPRCNPGCLPSEMCTDGYCVPRMDAGPDAPADVGPDAPTCPTPGQTWCGAGCVDTASDPTNCGACGTICPGLGTANITVRCLSTVCSRTCVAPFLDCDRDLSTGCEFRGGTDGNCGTCGHVCPAGTRCVLDPITAPWGECH